MRDKTRKTIFNSPAKRRTRGNHSSATPEALETRTLLSNVSVSFNGQNLVIRGDNRDNEVFVGHAAPGPGGSGVYVRGIDGTRINNSFGVFLLGSETVPGDIKASFRGGDNRFVISGVDIGDDVNIKGGKGDDVVGLAGDSHVGGSLTARTGNGNDMVGLQGTVDGSMKVTTGNGNDLIAMTFSDIDGKLLVATGKGRDQIGMEESRVGGDAVFKTGSGSDSILAEGMAMISKVDVALASGNDEVAFNDSAIVGAMRLDGGSGVDAYDISGTGFLTSRDTTAFERDITPFVSLRLDELFVEISDEFAGFPI